MTDDKKKQGVKLGVGSRDGDAASVTVSDDNKSPSQLEAESSERIAAAEKASRDKIAAAEKDFEDKIAAEDKVRSEQSLVKKKMIVTVAHYSREKDSYGKPVLFKKGAAVDMKNIKSYDKDYIKANYSS